MKKHQTNILLAIGLIISSVAQIISHFNKLPDLVSGSLIGVGIGFMLVVLIINTMRPNILNRDETKENE